MVEFFRERVDMVVFGAVPEFVRISVCLRAIEPDRRADRVAALLAQAALAVRTSIHDERRFAAWRDAYAAVGLGADVVPPPQALAAWAATPGGVPSQGALTDLVNAFALQHLLPAAAYDLGATSGDLWLRPSCGTEHFEPLGGGPPESPPIGELILADSADLVLARPWHGAQGRPTVPGPLTRNALVHLDLLGPLADDAASLAEAFLRLAADYLGAHGQALVLARTTPQVAWPA